ncbi:MAG: nickel pincer cofactor biosynthesis protein LarC [Candidatus Hadarchaeia archaeon]
MTNKAIYLDCYSGVAGDMLLGTLIDLGASKAILNDLVGKLDVDAEIKVENLKKGAEIAKRVTVLSDDERERHISDIRTLLRDSNLSDYVLEKSLKTFDELAEAESEIHGVEKGEVHFHEVGAVDSIIDIVGTFALLEDIKPTKVYCSKVNLGRGGTIRTEHGEVSNPAPATVELLEGIPVYSTIEDEETVTPTGAVLLRNIVDKFDAFPTMKVLRSGRGAGSKELPVPNLLRSILGEIEEPSAHDPRSEKIIRIETNIDDCNPELIGEAVNRLLSAGALDVYQVPVNMKKNRTGVELVVLCEAKILPQIESILFEETTTFGFRYVEMEKRELPREVKQIETKYGDIAVKVGYFKDRKTVTPEFDSCLEAAKRKQESLRDVYEEARKEALIQEGNKEDTS